MKKIFTNYESMRLSAFGENIRIYKKIVMRKIVATVIFTLVFAIISNVVCAQDLNPLPGVTSFDVLFQRAMNYFTTIAGTIAVIFIVVGGVMYMVSGGNTGMMERAKKTLIFAMVGLAIVIAAPLFLQDIQLILNGGGGSGTSKLLLVAMNVLRLLLSIVGSLAILGILNSAVIMLVSTGHDKTLTAAKRAFAHSLIGFALATGALILISAMRTVVLGG